MDQQASILILLLIYPVARFVYVLAHELGHAGASLALTKGDVKVYIGSYGEPGDGMRLRFKRLHVVFTSNPSRWYHGSCVQDTSETSLKGYLIIILAGPLAAFLLGAISLYVVLLLDTTSVLYWFLLLLVGSAVLGVINLVPMRWRSYRGELMRNDGARAIDLLRSRGYYTTWKAANAFYRQQQFADAAILFEDILCRHERPKEIYRPAISAYLLANNVQKAYELNRQFEESYEMGADDWATSGSIKSQLGYHEEALIDYQKALHADRRNSRALDDRGYTLNLLERYAEAIKDFDRAIEVEPNSAYSYSNRGLAKIKLGMMDEGLSDIQYALELDDKNSYAYRNLGIYHFDRGNFIFALELLEKARSFDVDTHLVDDYIKFAREQMKSA